jgi:transcriptional regulator with XRE-family HTH domain
MTTIRQTMDQLRNRRVSKGLTQRAIAIPMGVGDTYISRLETGEGDPCWKTLCKYAKVLGLQLDIKIVPIKCVSCSITPDKAAVLETDQGFYCEKCFSKFKKVKNEPRKN